MPPSPIPAPLPPWAKFLLQILPFISAGLQEALDHIGPMNDASSSTPSEWRHIQLVFRNTADVEFADRAVTGFDIANITNGAIDNTWTDADYTAVDAQMVNLLQGWAPHMNASFTTVEARYYRRMFNPLSDPRPFTKVGAPERVITHAYPGTGTGTQARQVAITSTERTTYPRHWGRNYWPFPHSTELDNNGYVVQANVDALATLISNAYLTLAQAEFFPVVPVTQVEGVATRGLLGVTQVQVDNNPDVVRRRRIKLTTYRKTLPALP